MFIFRVNLTTTWVRYAESSIIPPPFEIHPRLHVATNGLHAATGFLMRPGSLWGCVRISISRWFTTKYGLCGKGNHRPLKKWGRTQCNARAGPSGGRKIRKYESRFIKTGSFAGRLNTNSATAFLGYTLLHKLMAKICNFYLHREKYGVIIM